MNWASFTDGLALGGALGFWIAWALSRKAAEDLKWDRDDARAGLQACLQRLRDAGGNVRRTDLLKEVQDQVGGL